MREHFYHGTTRNYIVAFASLFDHVFCETDGGEVTAVPLHYAPRAKWMEMLDSDMDKDATDISTTLPRMAFELTGLNYAPERHLNPNHQIAMMGDSVASYNRVPYDFSLSLYVATKQFDDSLEIVEQIAPMFTPDFTVSVKEKIGDMEVATNLTVVLNSASVNIDYEGSFTDPRRIEWTLNFTLKGFVYPNARRLARIKETIVGLFAGSVEAPGDLFTAVGHVVVPRGAEKDDPHTVVESITGG